MASNLGKLIREQRRQRGLRQEDLASAVGRYLKTIGNWERGSTQPSSSDIARLGEVLRVAFHQDPETGDWSTHPTEPPRIEGAVPFAVDGSGVYLYFRPGFLDQIDHDALDEAVSGGRREIYRIVDEIRRRRDSPRT